jgi:hypothetical protein
MSIFDDLASTMDGFVGAGMGGWVLGAILIFALLFPIALAMFVRRGSGPSGVVLILMVSAFGVIFNTGVGWWDPFALIAIVVFILLAWWVSRVGGGGGGI